MSDEPDRPEINKETREAIFRWSEKPEVRATMNAATQSIADQNRAIETALNQTVAPIREYMKRFDAIIAKAFEPLIEQNRQISEAISKALPDLRNFVRFALPANLRRVERFERVADITATDGIPLVHVPRGEIVTEILAAGDSDARRRVIEARTDDILDDCVRALAEPVADEKTDRSRQMAIRAVDACRSGFFEGAQSVAVLLSEGLIADRVHKDHNKARDRVQKMVARDQAGLILEHFNFTLSLWVVPTLYHSWSPATPATVPMPIPPSRHVTAHFITADNVNPVNAVIALMQVTCLVAAARWDEEWRVPLTEAQEKRGEQ